MRNHTQTVNIDIFWMSRNSERFFLPLFSCAQKIRKRFIHFNYTETRNEQNKYTIKNTVGTIEQSIIYINRNVEDKAHIKHNSIH